LTGSEGYLNAELCNLAEPKMMTIPFMSLQNPSDVSLFRFQYCVEGGFIIIIIIILFIFVVVVVAAIYVPVFRNF